MLMSLMHPPYMFKQDSVITHRARETVDQLSRETRVYSSNTLAIKQP